MVTILIPKHVSVPPPEHIFIIAVYHSAGVAWRGLAPIILEAPAVTLKRFLCIVWERSRCMPLSFSSDIVKTHESHGEYREDENDIFPGFHYRLLQDEEDGFSKLITAVPSGPPVTIVVLPPVGPSIDGTFASLVVRTEKLLLKMQTLTAWWATLGGGYFFCRRLQVSLQLARQQRMLALQIGNIPMARQCSINEAYNLIYAGKFRSAKRVLQELQENVADDPVTINQCNAAMLLARRLKQCSKRGIRAYHTSEKGISLTVDDLQRVRIVQD